MYRKPLLTIEDAEALTGQLVRLEWSTYSAPLIGIATGVNGRKVMYRDADARERGLTFLQGSYVVFATTEVIESEQPFRQVRWRDRPGQEAEAVSAYLSGGIVNPGMPYPPLNLQSSGYLQRWAAEQFLLVQGDYIDREQSRLQEVQTPLQQGERLHYDFSTGTV
jgi:hypothetical protein